MANSNRTPLVGSLVLTGKSTSFLLGTIMKATVGALVLTGAAPIETSVAIRPATGILFVGLDPNANIQPACGALTLSGASPILNGGVLPTVGSLTTSGLAGSAVSSTLRTPAVGGLTGSGAASLLAQAMPGTTGSLTLTGTVPLQGTIGGPASGGASLSGVAGFAVAGTVCTPIVGGLGLTGLAPSLDYGLLGTAGALTLTGAAPTAFAPVNMSRTPSTGELWFGLFGNIPIAVPTSALALTGAPPTVQVFGSNASITTLVGSLSFGLDTNSPVTGSLALTGAAPILSLNNLTVAPLTGALTLSGVAPVRSGQSTTLTPSTADLFLGLVTDQHIQPAGGVLTLTGRQANPPDNTDRTPDTGAVVFTRPTSASRTPPTGALVLTASQANPPPNTNLTPATGTLRLIRGVEITKTGLTLVGFAPLVQVAGTGSTTTRSPAVGRLNAIGGLAASGLTVHVSGGSLNVSGSQAGTDFSNREVKPASGTLGLVATAPFQPFVIASGPAREGCSAVTGTAVEGCGGLTTTAQEGCAAVAETTMGHLV